MCIINHCWELPEPSQDLCEVFTLWILKWKKNAWRKNKHTNKQTKTETAKVVPRSIPEGFLLNVNDQVWGEGMQARLQQLSTAHGGNMILRILHLPCIHSSVLFHPWFPRGSLCAKTSEPPNICWSVRNLTHCSHFVCFCPDEDGWFSWLCNFRSVADPGA